MRVGLGSEGAGWPKVRRISLWKLLFGKIDIPWPKECGETVEPGKPPLPKAEKTWNLHDNILQWSKHPDDAWTLEDALRGTAVFGSTGGGKSSGAGDAIARAYLRAGFGGLVLCVKEDEGDYWERLCEQTGRRGDLCRVGVDSAFQYNFLEAEAGAGASLLTMNVSELFSEVISLVNRTGKNSQKDSFWTDVLMQTLNHAIVLEAAADDQITVPGLTKIINAAVAAAKPVDQSPPLLGKVRPEDALVPFLQSVYRRARAKRPDDLEIELAVQFFTGEFAGLAEKTRSIVVTTFTSMADALMRRPLRELLSEKTTVKPEDAFEGKILVIDVPIHVYHRVGQVMNLIWKTAFKRACQRRKNLSESRRPVFLWADESHYLFDQVDGEFQTTARSSLCCTVLLTQNLQNYFAKTGDRASVEALLGSLHNKVFHQNNENETNRYASDAIGRVPIDMKSISQGPGGTKTISTSQQWDYDVPPRAFTNLRSGGARNSFQVDAILHLPGRRFSAGKTWLKVQFDQIRV